MWSASKPRNFYNQLRTVGRGITAGYNFGKGVYNGYKTGKRMLKKYGGGAPARKRRRISKGGGVIKSGFSGITFSGFRKKKKLYPSVRTVLRSNQLSVYRITDTDRVEWDAGAQAARSYTLGTAADMQLLFANIGASGTGQDTTRMIVKNMKMKWNLTNQSNANCIITLYDIEYRNDANVGDFGTPILAWANGIARAEEGGDAPGIANVGSTPFMSSDFCRNYRVVKVTKIYLDPGKSHVHFIRIASNKMLNNGMTDPSAQPVAYRGFSHGLMAVFQGLPVNDGTTDTLIAMGSGAVDIVEEREYQQAYPQYGLKRYYNDNNQGTITTEKFVGDETGDVETYTEA